MGPRGLFYCVVIAGLICGCLALAVWATAEPAGWLYAPLRASFHDWALATMVVVFVGGIGLALLMVQPLFGLIYRYDRATFRQMLAPRYGVRPPSRPVPPLDASALGRLARVPVLAGGAVGLGLLAAHGLRLLGPDGLNWVGLACVTGLWLGGAVLVGRRLYLQLRDTAR